MKRLFLALTACLTLWTAEAQNMDFAARFLRQNRSEHPGENLCLSPASVQMALAMVANGAEGKTRREILDALGWKGETMAQVNQTEQKAMQTLQSTEDVTVEMANSIWLNRSATGSVKRSFTKTNQAYYDAEVVRLTFNAAATERINRWCATHTRDKITSILDQVDPAAQMYLLNALYFKGTWIHRFAEGATHPDLFTRADGQREEVPMMHQQAYFDYADLPLCQLVDMPFVSVGGPQYSLYVALPAEGVTADVLLDALTAETWGEWTSALRSEDVRLTLPKFRVEYSALLNETLQALGIRRAFSTAQADFSGIVPSSLAIDRVVQKTYFDVTETGAEAAAVTAITMMRTSLPRPHKVRVMNVNRPFLFVLAEKSSGQVLFVGKVERPAAK